LAIKNPAGEDGVFYPLSRDAHTTRGEGFWPKGVVGLVYLHIDICAMLKLMDKYT
jgi:hypothetical protein